MYQSDELAKNTQAMWSKSNHAQKKQEFFKVNYKALGLDKVESCISMGAGQGDLDSYILRECMPNLKQYHGEEPCDRLREQLEREITSCNSSVEVKIYSEPAETWEGPGVQVDAVLAIQCLLFIQERQRFLSKCRDWLKPGGILVVVSHSSDSFLTKAAQLFEPKAALNIHSDFTRSDLQAIGITDFKEFRFSMEAWIEDGDRNYVAFALKREVTDEEVKAFYEFRQKHSPAAAIITNSDVFHWQKPRNVTNII